MRAHDYARSLLRDASECATLTFMQYAIDFAIKRVRAFWQTQGWTKTEYARLAKLKHESNLRNLDPGKPWNPKAATIRALESVIPSDFMPPPPCERKAKNGNGKRGK